MLLQMSVMLAIASTVVEGFIAWYLPGWRTITKKFRLLDIIFSFALSWLMGKMFGAEGLVIAMGGIMSTMMSMPMYPLLDWYEKNQAEVKTQYAKFRQTMIDLAILTWKIIRLITIPIRVSRWAHQQFAAVRAGVKAL